MRSRIDCARLSPCAINWPAMYCSSDRVGPCDLGAILLLNSSVEQMSRSSSTSTGLPRYGSLLGVRMTGGYGTVMGVELFMSRCEQTDSLTHQGAARVA